MLLPKTEDIGEPEAGFHYDTGESGEIDLDPIAEGYFLARCTTQRQAALTITKDDVTWVEYLPSDGSWWAYPLTMGEGEYTVEIRLNVQALEYEHNVKLTFDSAATPSHKLFLIPNYLVSFGQDSKTANMARQFYRDSWSDKDMADDVLRWMGTNLVYDEDLSQELDGANTIYVPDHDRFLERGQGICLDYASLFAALMRSVGIPCQLIYGDVNLGAAGVKYHAWNHVWLEDEEGNGAWWRYDSTAGYQPYQLDSGKREPVIYAGESIYSEPERIY